MTDQNPFSEIAARLAAIENKLENIQQPTQAPEKKYYPVSEAAKRLGVHAITLYRGIDNGTIPHRKVGCKILIPGSYVD